MPSSYDNTIVYGISYKENRKVIQCLPWCGSQFVILLIV